MFEKGKMSLYKWCSNDKMLVQGNKENYIFANPKEIKT